MVLNRRLDYGFNGHDSPLVPRAPRSLRRRGLRNRTSKDSQFCAFELLATVAGKLLLECESSAASSSVAMVPESFTISKDVIKQEEQNVCYPVQKCGEQRSLEESVFISMLSLKNSNPKETSSLVSDTAFEAAVKNRSAVAGSPCSGKLDSDMDSTVLKEDSFIKLRTVLERGSPNLGDSNNASLGSSTPRTYNCTGTGAGNCNRVEAGAKVADGPHWKFPTSNNVNEIMALPLSRSSNTCTALLPVKNDSKLCTPDDDDNYFRFPHLKTETKAMLSPPHCDDHRVKNLLTYNTQRVTPKLEDSEVACTVRKIKKIHEIRRPSSEHERSQFETAFKKRKLFDQSSAVTYDGCNSSDNVSNSLKKTTDVAKSDWGSKLQTVKCTIESFKVPELFIEIPENTTIGSLKRTILEAVIDILGGGLRVGVLLNGKKVQDDDRTLQQAGISQNGNLDALGFLLEPRKSSRPAPVFPGNPIPLACSSLKSCVNRHHLTSTEDMSLSNTTGKSSVANARSDGDNNKDLVPCPTPTLGSKTEPDSRALMPVPAVSMEALAMVRVNARPGRPEFGQRRTRRPFSVAEVEALVEAVEKHGTGRWRDVKLCAFENAKHRNYVDLKDKWKTLVHTARISPQQRRGEPVPQELLDRVLAAHACWTQNQTKQQGKPQPELLKPTVVPSS